MMGYGLCALLLLIMKRWPDTPFARALHHWLVALPLAAIERVSRRRFIFLCVLLVVAPGMGAMVSADLAILLSMDIATYVDIALTAWTLAMFARVRGAGRTVFARLPRPRLPLGRARRRRMARRTTARLKPANDDDDPAALRAA